MQAHVKDDSGVPGKSSKDDLTTGKLKRVLKDLNMVSEDIEASAVITRDGLVKAAILGESIDPDRFGAMCATLLALAKRAAVETSRGDLRLVLIEGTKGTMLVVQSGENSVLALAAKPKTNLGMVFIKAKNAASEIASII